MAMGTTIRFRRDSGDLVERIDPDRGLLFVFNNRQKPQREVFTHLRVSCAMKTLCRAVPGINLRAAATSSSRFFEGSPVTPTRNTNAGISSIPTDMMHTHFLREHDFPDDEVLPFPSDVKEEEKK